MTAPQYQRLSAPFRGKVRERGLLLTNKILTWGCYIAYPLLLVLLFLEDWRMGIRGLLVPGISFAALSLVRKGINAPRPYEVLDINPIIKKNTRGKSMPSRHVFSIFVIAMAWLWYLPGVGAVLLVCGGVLACIRVIGGVHFPRDVLAGAAVGVACGLIGFWLI